MLRRDDLDRLPASPLSRPSAFKPAVNRGQPFRHPRGMEQIWKGSNCTDCHGLTPHKAAEHKH